ncbi:MAG: sodium:solute symporter family protein [bacterium]
MHILDWTILAMYMLIMLVVGFLYKNRAKKSLSDYFLSGRNFPWWLAGTSIVATTLSVDTPLAVTGFVAKNGIAGNWFWWLTCLSSMTVAFFFARLWRRSNVLTDVEFIELRYSGKSAAVLRGFAAVYRGLFLNVIKLAWVILAMSKILDSLFSVGKETSLIVSVAVVVVYSVMSGLWGVVIADFLQFFIAMGGSIVFAVLAVRHVGGIGGLETALLQRFGEQGTADMLAVLPPLGSMWMPFFTLFVYLGIMWWSDAHIEGGGYVAQRLMASKDEKHAVFASIWFNFAHVALRPWPWIMVALVSLVVFPDLVDKEAGFPMMMNLVLPAGLKGLMVTAFFAAFMSTISTLMNWGSSYLVNDLYKRFMAKGKTERHYLCASKVCDATILVLAYFVSKGMNSIVGMWELLFSFTAGLGVIYAARWFWWRVNAWSEVTAMVASGIMSIVLTTQTSLDFPHKIVIILPVSIVAWMTVTFLTKPVETSRLVEFYKRARPYPLLWKKILVQMPDAANYACPDDFYRNVRCWLWGVLSVYTLLFAIGKWVFLQTVPALMLTASCIFFSALLARELLAAEKAKGEGECVPAIAQPALETE